MPAVAYIPSNVVLAIFERTQHDLKHRTDIPLLPPDPVPSESPSDFRPHADQTRNVLENERLGMRRSQHPHNLAIQLSLLVVQPSLLPPRREWLAWKSAGENVDIGRYVLLRANIEYVRFQEMAPRRGKVATINRCRVRIDFVGENASPSYGFQAEAESPDASEQFRECKCCRCRCRWFCCWRLPVHWSSSRPTQISCCCRTTGVVLQAPQLVHRVSPESRRISMRPGSTQSRQVRAVVSFQKFR
mmetsp:Transcript_34444/g.72508  ORF Transcript_34444/g.72508 Transcript_34444/m.72508 type:complete len:245 (-) Transcript_34444:52-786(-)